MNRQKLVLRAAVAAIITGVVVSPGLRMTRHSSEAKGANDQPPATGLAAMAAAPSRVPIPESSFLPVAVWYGGGKVRAPMLERLNTASAAGWGKDLDQIKSVGFNTVKCWVDWATAEPRPDDFHFENLDLLLRLAQERGLRVIVQVYLDSAPDWVGERYPDGQFVDRSGSVVKSQSAPGFCIDHPGVRAEIVKFLQALSSAANCSPALCGWDVWSEPHVINWADFPYLSNPEFCFCPHTQARFREWLKSKYPNLEALNAAWYRRFDRWEQVEPPRASTILSYTDYLDWRTFIDDKLAGDLKARVEAVRSADQAHPVTSHAAVPGLFTSPTDGFGEPDDWKMAASADFFGTSVYPKHSQSTRPWPYPMLAAALDFTRSSGHSFGKGFWIGELQAGQGVTGMRIADPVDAHDERLWMWQVLAHGARSLAIYAWYPMSSGYESNGYGLINLDGTLTERARAAGKVAQVMERHASEILASEPAPARIAILYNRLSSMVGGAQPSLSKLGNAERDSLMGLHRAFLEQQIPVDFVHPEDVAQGKLSQYRILFLPYPVMLARTVAAGVAAFVQGGGTAIAEARLAWNDERGFASDAVPGFGLDEVFGARETMIRPVDKPRLIIATGAGLVGLSPQEPVFAEAFEEELAPMGKARVLGRFANGQPAMVENSYGKGKAILVGSFPALAFERHAYSSTGRLLLALARYAGVSPEVEVTGARAQGSSPASDGRPTSEIEIRRLVSNRSQIIFAFNHAVTPMRITVSVRLPWRTAEARNLEDDQVVSFKSEGGRTTFGKTLAEGEIWIVRLGRE